MRRTTFLLLILTLPLGGICAAKGGLKPQDRLPVDLYVMSLCPYGVQAENGLLPVVKALDGYVVLNLNFIASQVEGSTAPVPSFRSLHGQSEVDENIRQVCIKKLFPAKYMDYILKRDQKVRDADWQSVLKSVGGDPAAVEKCFSSGEGAKLHAENIQAALKRQANGSPTIDVGGKPYQGGRSQRAFAEALCGALKAKNVLPEACKDLSKFPGDAGAASSGDCGPGGAAGPPAAAAKPVEFGVTILVDAGCPVCGPTLEGALKSQHPAAKFTTVDAASAEGRSLVGKYGVRSLPFYFLDKGVEKDPGFNTLLNQFYAKAGDGYVVKPGQGTFRPQVQLGRKKLPNHLDLFVEALSPFAAQAELEFIRHLEKADLKDVTVSFHFITEEGVKAESQPGGKSDETRSASLKEAKAAPAQGALLAGRGDAEVQEDLRQACLFQNAPMGTFLAYLDCRNQNLSDQGRGAACLQADERIKSCVTGGEGEKILRRDARLVRELDLNTTVGVLWENQYGPFGWNEVDWKKLISK